MKPQSTWVTAVYTLSLISIVSLFVVIALQINTSNTMKRQEELLSSMSRDIKDFKGSVDKLVLTGTVTLDDIDDLEELEDDMKMSNDSIISIEEIDSFVEDKDIIIDEKIIVHTENSFTERKVGDHITLPDIPTNTYRCEPYLRYNIETETWENAFVKGSHQNKLNQVCQTDEETGIRYYTDKNGKKWYCAALAGAFGIKIGALYEFTLANGTVIPVIQADYKHDITKCRSDDFGDEDINYDGEATISVIEFVVDLNAIPRSAYVYGTMSALDKFGGPYGHGGNIVEVTYCGVNTDFLGE